MVPHKKASLFLTLLFSVNTYAEITLTSAQGTSNERKTYAHQLLQAALNTTAVDNHIDSVKQVPVSYGYDARTYLVTKGQADVTYFPAEKQVEKQLIPIRIPIYKGLMGYRFLLINSKTQAKYDAIMDVSQLKGLIKGTGTRWRMTEVYESHNFLNVKAEKNHSLFKMLNAGRIDYTTRGVIEAAETLNSIERHFPNLKIENSILLYTELPIYFFVGTHNPKLAKRIEAGLLQMIESGQFDKIFYAFYKTIPTSLTLKNRKVFHVENPFLSTETKENALNFWQQHNSPLPF
ncbi:transporter substrate-binding domain-containing protein [Catenovulum agarivorans]|uniref:transporter substrate-binding domain-containing protein n=1 Tax=Catenovulum agarivorans TaxID=1172192 RepID=UPI0002E6356E|nr:transporter substrate-binding domain-containing protein [Catenovulum agarivorans]